MKHPLRSAVFAALLCGPALTGCFKPSKPAAEDTAAPAADTGSMATAASGDDPCAIVSKGEVRDVFPGAEAGKPDHSMDQYGMASCTWELPTNTLAAQTFKSTNTAGEELRGRMLGFLDPLQPGLREKIQYDTIAGLGDEAVAVAVKADAAQGILADSAMLGIRKGDRMVVLFTRGLVDGDAAASKKALEALGGKAASRL
jgi:hypothetical protein